METNGGNASDAALVLEDDMHLATELSSWCISSEWFPQQADIVRLETTYQGMRFGETVPVRHSNRLTRRVRSEAWGAGAYFLRREAARRLIDRPIREHLPVDYFLFDKRASEVAKRITSYQIAPALAVQDKYIRSGERVGFQSLIEKGFRGHTKPGTLSRMTGSLGRKLKMKSVIPYLG